jgi:hypothetical protein
MAVATDKRAWKDRARILPWTGLQRWFTPNKPMFRCCVPLSTLIYCTKAWVKHLYEEYLTCVCPYFLIDKCLSENKITVNQMS